MSYFLKDAGNIDEETCETSCRSNPDCGFYIHFSTTKITRCVCGQYATSNEVVDPESLPPTVTLKYKKGEPKQNFFKVQHPTGREKIKSIPTLIE